MILEEEEFMFGGDLGHANLLINYCLFWGFYGMVGGVHRAPLSVNRTFLGRLLSSSPLKRSWWGECSKKDTG
jgi:hypothetical protein